MDWWTQNKDAITAIGAAIGSLLAIGGIIWAAIKWGFLRGWQRKLRVDVSVFEVITDPAVLLPKLYATENDKSPLADHNIKYQPRDPKRDIQAELKAALNRSRYLLVTAPTGYGKTREAGMLAQTLMLEGWRVLRIVKTGWLDVPKTFPKELNDNRSRILIFLDDLNGMFSTGTRTESPRAEKIPLLSEASYHDRLLQVLDFFEGVVRSMKFGCSPPPAAKPSNGNCWTSMRKINFGGVLEGSNSPNLPTAPLSAYWMTTRNKPA
jgi:hypothetical protein